MISFLLAAVVWLVPGSTSVWTDGVYTWGGPQWCAETGFLLSPDSPAIDTGAFIEGFHCPAPGLDPSGCMEWYGAAPDIGACEHFPNAAPPTAVVATLLGQTGEDIAGTFTEGADGVLDVHIRLSNVSEAITGVKVTGEADGFWEGPPNGANWLVVIQPADLYFDFYRPNDSYRLDITYASGAVQSVQTRAPLTPAPPQAVTVQ